MSSAEARLCDVALDRSFGRRDPRVEREQALAGIDLLDNNRFLPVGHEGGPYRLRIETGRLVLHIADDEGAHVVSQRVSITPFRRLLKDYTRICDSYYDAIRRMDRSDCHRSARRLFTLIYAMLVRHPPHQILPI
ncbi:MULTISPECIES: UPF0262 family protein [unclassified Sinorhizobium]|uniref:UPF0262 family protein n=1 Tax=unclassified Sinorhizobium TaxID=2613772 RepID=UPI0024C22F9C|nr:MULTISPECIES: UPF0262 family protein [unclassified Sinorhizobium]MDK1378618.1 UPF0262 family protein [Sinorhizobium sp. 6-70]MDK1483049.1 UPF0262 family protein [Sinorhizobium sp. 6-117]